MKGFWLILMLLGLLVTAWLVTKNLSEPGGAGGSPAALKTMERAQQLKATVGAAEKAAERRLDGAARE